MGPAQSDGVGVGALAVGALVVVLLLVSGVVMMLWGGDDSRPAGAAPLVLDIGSGEALMSLPEAVVAPGSETSGRPPPLALRPGTGAPEALVGHATPLAASGLLRLRVVDPQGGPVEEAEVQVMALSDLVLAESSEVDLPAPLVTDEAGLVVLPALSEATVLARHDRVGTSAPTELAALVARGGDEGVVDLVLEPLAQVDVSVVTYDGAPAGGCQVRSYGMGFFAKFSDLPGQTPTDASGRVTLPFASHLTLIVHAGYADQPKTEWSGVGMAEAGPGETTLVVLTLPGPWRAFGAVVGWDGAPVPGAEVAVWRYLPGGDLDGGRLPPGDPWRHDTNADDEGRFHVVLPAPGEYQLLASGAGHAPSEVQRVTVSPSMPRAETWLTQPDEASIAGRLVDGRGEPLAGVAVQARPAHQFNRARERHGPTVFSRLGQAAGVTDADGRFSLSPLHPDGVYIVWCRPDEAQRDGKLVVPDVPAGTTDLALVADEANLARAVVEVGVTAGGRPVEGITSVLLIELDGKVINTKQIPYPSPAGQLRYQGLAPGRSYRLRVDGPECGAVELPWFEARVGVQRFEVALPKPGAIDVRVQDDAGQPREGATVSTRPVSDFPLGRAGTRSVTDVAGRALLGDLDPGPHALRVRFDGREVTREVEVLSGAVESVTVTL